MCNNYNLQICILCSSCCCCSRCCCCWLPLMLTRWRNESKCCTIAGRGPDLLDSAQNTEWVGQESIPFLLYHWAKAKAKAKASFVWLEILKLTWSGFTLPSFFTLLVFFLSCSFLLALSACIIVVAAVGKMIMTMMKLKRVRWHRQNTHTHAVDISMCLHPKTCNLPLD